MKYLWKLTFKDKEVVEIPEDSAMRLRAAMARGDRFYTNPVRTFAIDQIKSLEKTSKIDTDGQRLLADADAALSKDKPIYVTLESGEVAVKALLLKMQVTKADWERYYSKNLCYRRLDDIGDGTVWLAYTRPAHLGIPTGHVLIVE